MTNAVNMAAPPLLHTAQEASDWLKSKACTTLTSNSKCILPGGAFIAWRGLQYDARANVTDALTIDANACLIEDAGSESFGFTDTRIARVKNLRSLAGQIASTFYNHPSKDLAVVAVTGTNGKTSIAWWLAQMLSKIDPSDSHKAAMIGTLGIGTPPNAEHTGLTTPDAVCLQTSLYRFVHSGFRACALEASSIGIASGRLDGLHIDTAVFTNLTQDHLDYHGSMINYWSAKRSLFDWIGLRVAVVNVDDGHGAKLSDEIAQKPIDLWTVSSSGVSARLQARNIHHSAGGISFDVFEDGRSTRVQSKAIGSFNVDNLLACIGVMRAHGATLERASQLCAELLQVPGRLECFGSRGQPFMIVDYAHTPDALEKALVAARQIATARGGLLWCVFGCGGDRDVTKRPTMGSHAQRLADRVVLTSDNPRSENPESIVSQILAGMNLGDSPSVEIDRRLAISGTIASANSKDVVLIAGKGHENFQEISGERFPFSDVAIVKTTIEAMSGAAAWI